MRTDPRIRQSLNRITSNLENATENARAGCFALTSYLEPYFANLADTCVSCTVFCMPGNSSSRHGRRRNQAQFPFDFYNDDFYDEDQANFFGWGSDELDRLLAGSGSSRGYTRQPAMSYGTRGHTGGNLNARGPARRKSAVVPHDGGPDPTIIPNTSYFGFLSSIPFMRSTLRYKPSAADLQDHPGQPRRTLFRRHRSATTSSGETEDSMRSRADLFPSEDEDDAVPLDDEFDVHLRSGPASETSLNAYRKKRRTKRPSSLGSSLSREEYLGDSSAVATPIDERSIANRLLIPDVDYHSDFSHNSPKTRRRPSHSRDSSYPASLSDISISENTNLLADPTANEQSHRLSSQDSTEDADILDVSQISSILGNAGKRRSTESGEASTERVRLTLSPEPMDEPQEAETIPSESTSEPATFTTAPSREESRPSTSLLSEPDDSPPAYDGDVKDYTANSSAPVSPDPLPRKKSIESLRLPKAVNFKFGNNEGDSKRAIGEPKPLPIFAPSPPPPSSRPITIPSSKTSPRLNATPFSKSFTEPSQFAHLAESSPNSKSETRSLSSSPTQSPKQLSKGLIERSLGLWTWSKLEEWFPPIVPKEEWLNSGFDERKMGSDNGEEREWNEEDGLVRRLKRSMDVIRD